MKDFRELDAELMEQMPNLKPNTTPISERFAGIVFSQRIRNGLTQQQLADEADVDIKTIHRIEGGNSGVSEAIYEKVILALNAHNQ